MKPIHALAAGLATVLLAVPLTAPAFDDEETRRERTLAGAAERQPRPAWSPGPVLPALATPSDPVLASLRGALQEGVFIGVDDIAIPTYVVDTVSAAATPVFSGFQVWAAAYVQGPAGGSIFFSSGSVLNVSLGGAPPSACCGLSIDGVNAASVVGMAWDPLQQRFLFSRNIGTEEIYALPYSPTLCTAAPLCTISPVAAPVAASVDLGGLAFAPDTATLYATNDAAALRGIVRVDLVTGDVVVVAPYPVGQTDIDGLAYHAGRLYLVTDEPGDIFVYDLALPGYVAPLANPWTTAEVFSAGAFIVFDTIFANGFDPIPVASPAP